MVTAILLGPCKAMAKTANIDMSNGKDISLTESVKLVASSMAKGGPAKKPKHSDRTALTLAMDMDSY